MRYLLLMWCFLMQAGVASDSRFTLSDHIIAGEQQRLNLPMFSSEYAILNIHLQGVDLAQSGLSLSLCETQTDETKNIPQQSDCTLLLDDVTRHGEKHLKTATDRHYDLLLDLPASQAKTIAYRLDIDSIATQAATDSAHFDAHPSSPTLQRLQQQLNNATNQTEKTQLLQDFWQTIAERGTPLIESLTKPSNGQQVKMTFLWRAARHNVRLIGGPANDHIWLTRLPDSDVWFKSFDVPNDTRLSYQFAPDIPTLALAEDNPLAQRQQRLALLSTLTADPLNRNAFPQMLDKPLPPDQRYSLVVLKPTVLENYLMISKENPIGNRLTLTPYSDATQTFTRRVWLYRPPSDPLSNQGQNGNNAIVLYFFDGQEYVERAGIPQILDNLINAHRLPPVYAVFIDNPDRTARSNQLPGNEKFAEFIAQQLVPWSHQQLAITTDKVDNVLIGSSYGGLASAFIAGHYPQVFDRVIALSGSFWWHPDGKEENAIAHFFADSATKNIRFFLAAGRFETARNNELSILDSNQQLFEVLEEKGYDVEFRLYSSGHDYAMWQQELLDGLLFLIAN